MFLSIYWTVLSVSTAMHSCLGSSFRQAHSKHVQPHLIRSTKSTPRLILLQSLSQRIFHPLTGLCFACDMEDTWNCFPDSCHFHFMGRCRKSLVPTAMERRNVFLNRTSSFNDSCSSGCLWDFRRSSLPSWPWLRCVASMRGLCAYPMETNNFEDI